MNKFLDIGNLIRTARQSKLLSQKDLANLLNISSQLLYKYENNISRPTLEVLFHICSILNIKLDILLDKYICNDKSIETTNKGISSNLIENSENGNLKNFTHSILKLRRKFTKIKDIQHAQQLIEINRKLINKSKKELVVINRLIK